MFNPSINNSKHLTRENSKEDFETRVKKYIAQKKQHSEEIKNKINKEFEQNFSFTPKINTSKISKNNSTHSFFFKTTNEKKPGQRNNLKIKIMKMDRIVICKPEIAKT